MLGLAKFCASPKNHLFFLTLRLLVPADSPTRNPFSVSSALKTLEDAPLSRKLLLRTYLRH